MCVSGKYVMTMPGKLMYDTLSGRIRLIWLSPERGPLLEKEKKKNPSKETQAVTSTTFINQICVSGGKQFWLLSNDSLYST